MTQRPGVRLTRAVVLEALLLLLILRRHAGRRPIGPHHHLAQGPLVDGGGVHARLEGHGGRPGVEAAVGAHPKAAEHGQGPALRRAADLVAAGDLDAQQVRDGRHDARDVLG